MKIVHPNLKWIALPALAAYGIYNASPDESAAKKPSTNVVTPAETNSNDAFLRNVAETDWIVVNKLKSNASWMEFLKSINVSTEDLYRSKDKDPKESFINQQALLKNKSSTERINNLNNDDQLLQQIPAAELMEWWSIQNWISKNPEQAKEHLKQHASSLGLGVLEQILIVGDNFDWGNGIYSQILHPDLDTRSKLHLAIDLATIHRRAAQPLPIPKEETLISLYDAATRELKNARPVLTALHQAQ